MTNVLIVDDHDDLAQTVAEIVRVHGGVASVCNCGHDALRLTLHQAFDLMILDNAMPGLTGFDVLRRLAERRHGPLAPQVVMFSASTTARREAIALGASHYFVKTDVDELFNFIESRCCS